MTVRNNGNAALHGWTVTWTFADGQTIGNLCGAIRTQTGADVTAHSLPWNAGVAPGGSATLGFTGRLPGPANAAPTPSCTPASPS